MWGWGGWGWGCLLPFYLRPGNMILDVEPIRCVRVFRVNQSGAYVFSG